MIVLNQSTARSRNLIVINSLSALRRYAGALRTPLTIVAAVSGAWLFIQCVAEVPSVPVAVTAAASALAAGFLPSTSSREGGEA